MGIVLMLLPVIYLLGIGPACAIATRFPVTQDFLAAIYRPVLYAGEHFEPIRRVFDWYMSFWLD